MVKHISRPDSLQSFLLVLKKRLTSRNHLHFIIAMEIGSYPVHAAGAPEQRISVRQYRSSRSNCRAWSLTDSEALIKECLSYLICVPVYVCTSIQITHPAAWVSIPPFTTSPRQASLVRFWNSQVIRMCVCMTYARIVAIMSDTIRGPIFVIPTTIVHQYRKYCHCFQVSSSFCHYSSPSELH